MKLPREAPVMTLPNATLFPQSILPLRIFEPRYRKMLDDVLHSHRMFAVAMQKSGNSRETPSPVAGLGFVRASVRHPDGTSSLILQGLMRVELVKAARYRPYRIYRMRPLPTPPCDSVAADALLAKVRELLEERIHQPRPLPVSSAAYEDLESALSAAVSPKRILSFLDSVHDPERAADLVTSAILPGAAERQAILETVDVETRLRRLIQFLIVEISKCRKGKSHE